MSEPFTLKSRVLMSFYVSLEGSSEWEMGSELWSWIFLSFILSVPISVFAIVSSQVL